ncbi:MAG TPA: isocitrate lyase/phosphoenolpyruvate mutase family protein [Candidatus Methylomirabilis sp.]|jgi:2-methylisocitrate lyase-like PEP mutase family enzyme
MPTISAETLAAANAKSRRLRELIRAPRILVMPGAYDVLSAILFEALGFGAIQGASGGIQAAYGLRDDELLGLERTAAIYKEMADAVSVPVNADGERGYGGPEAMARTVGRFVAAGAAGMNLEDSESHAPGAPMRLVPMEVMVAKVRAVMEARRALGSEFFLNARVDVFGTGVSHTEGMTEAIERGNAYAEAGADCIFFFRPPGAEGIRTLVREVQAPVSILATADSPPVAELEALGVARVSYGTAFARAAITAVKRLAEELLRGGNPGPLLREAIPHPDLQVLLRGRG